MERGRGIALQGRSKNDIMNKNLDSDRQAAMAGVTLHELEEDRNI